MPPKKQKKEEKAPAEEVKPTNNIASHTPTLTHTQAVVSGGGYINERA